MNPFQQSYKAVGLVAALALAGCASTSVQPEQETAVSNLPPPSVVLVEKFGVNASEVKATQGLYGKAVDAVDRESTTEEEAALGQEVSNDVTNGLVQKLNAMGLNARRATPGGYVPAGALIVTGYFLDIDEGNKMQQLVVGLGLGETKMDSRVQVLLPTGDGQFRTLLEFETHADSGELPGAALTMGAGAAAQGTVTAGMAAANVALTGVKAYRGAMGPMSSRTVDKSATYLGKYFAGQGWISSDKVPQSMF